MKRSAFTAFAAAAASLPAVRVNAQTLTTIRFGTTPVESYALGIYAQEAGFFKKQGIDAQMNYFNGGGAVLTAMAGGSLDISCINWGATSNAFIRGVPIQVIAPGGLYSSESPTTILAVSKTSKLQTAKDLTGKTVGVSTIRDLQQAAVMKWTDANGGDSSTLKFVELPIPEMSAALTAGRIDAGIVLEPVLTSVKNDIRVFARCYDAVAKKLMICAHSGLADYLTKNAAVVRRVIAGLKETALWANANHDKAGDILVRVAKIPETTVATMARTLYTDQLDLTTIQPVIDASAQYKFIAKGYAATEAFWPGLKG